MDCDTRLKEIVNKVASKAAQANQRADDMTTVKAYTAEAHNRVNEPVKDSNEAQQKIKDEARKQDLRDTQYQLQMATLSSMIGTSGSSPSSGMRSHPD